MSKFFGRQYRVEIGSEETGKKVWDSRDSRDPLQLRFLIDTSFGGAYSTMQLSIFNVNKESIGQVMEADRVVLQAGYQDAFGVIFDGTIANLNAPKQGVNRILDVFCWSGLDRVQQKPATVSFAPDTSYFEIVDHIATDLFSKKPRYVGFSDDFKEAMGKATDGYNALQPHSTLLDKLGDDFGFDWLIEGDTVLLFENGKHRDGEPYLISPETGLVGGVALTWQGADVEMKLDPTIQIGDRVKVQSQATSINFSSIYQVNLPEEKKVIGDGVFVVKAMRRQGDFYGQNTWTSELTCWREGENGQGLR